MTIHTTVVFFVLLLLPNSTLTDWQKADAPELHILMNFGAIGLMNARTAEVDKITTKASVQSILNGVRRTGHAESSTVDVLSGPNALDTSLALSGVRVTYVNRSDGKFEHSATDTATKQFVAVLLPSNAAIADKQILYWTEQVVMHRGRLMIISSNPTVSEYQRLDQLTPILLWGQGVPHGYLSSASSRTKGLVVNTDVAPTIAAMLGSRLVKPSYGSEITVTHSSESAVRPLLQHDQIWMTQAKLLRIMPYLAAVIAVISLVAVILCSSGIQFGQRLASLCISIPLLLIFSPEPALLLFLELCFALCILYVRDSSILLIRVILLFTLVATMDPILLSGRWLGGSMLGYSPLEGARYYGVGNETMGLFVGSLVVVASWFVGRWKTPAYVVLWVTAGMILSLPACGAKAGGLIVCFLILSVTLTTLGGRRLFDVRTLVTEALALAGAIAVLVLVSHIGPKTHVSVAVSMAKKNGLETYIQIIARKASMDLHLVFHSVWIWVLLITSLGRWLYYRGAVGSSNPFLANTGTTAVLACLLFNDAGVVAAALCSLIVWGAEVNNFIVKFRPASVKADGRRAPLTQSL